MKYFTHFTYKKLLVYFVLLCILLFAVVYLINQEASVSSGTKEGYVTLADLRGEIRVDDASPNVFESMTGKVKAFFGFRPETIEYEEIVDEKSTFTADQIEKITINQGLDIPCPAIKGLPSNGYLYIVQFKDDISSIERAGCGYGDAEVYASAIASDLMNNFSFSDLEASDIFDKMVFNFYSTIAE
jgi:hypothetical protein